MFKRALSVIAASVFCICVASCSHGTQQAAPAATATPQHVHIVVSDSGRITPERTLSGFIAPLQNVTLSTTLTEPAAQVNVVEGDHVRSGQVLAVFDVSDLEANLRALQRSAAEADANTVRQQFQSSQTIGQSIGSAGQAQASLNAALAKLHQDERDLGRDEALQQNGYIARQTTDQQQTAVTNDRASVTSAQAALQAARITVDTNGTSKNGLQGASIAAERAAADAARAQADEIRAQISRATIASPVDGMVINRNLNPGEYPNGRTLFTIAQTGAVYGVLNASPAQIAGIHQGQTAAVVLNSQSNTARTAHIVAVLGQTVPGSTNFTVKALIDQADDNLLSGLPLSAHVKLDPVSGTRIPRSAFIDGTETHVITISNHVAHLQAVQVLAEDADFAIVHNLQPGVELVGDGNAGIADGDRVDASP